MTDSIDQTLQERGKRYGDFTEHANITQALKAVMMATPGWKNLQPMQKEALEMMQHKVGRILNGDPNWADSWIDISGYSKLVADRCPKARRPSPPSQHPASDAILFVSVGIPSAVT
jgi:hypothetical protein